MISIELKRTDGNFISINLPENSKELTLSQKLDFDFAQIGLISYLKKYEDNLFSNRAGYILQLAKGLSEFLELDLSVIMNLDGINLLEISQQDFLEHLKDNSFGYSFDCQFFITAVQGKNAEGEIIEALEKISHGF